MCHTIFAWPGLIGRVELIQSVRIQETMRDGLLSVTTIVELKGACAEFPFSNALKNGKKVILCTGFCMVLLPKLYQFGLLKHQNCGHASLTS